MPSGPGGDLGCKRGLQITGSMLVSGGPCGMEGLRTSLHLCQAPVSPRLSSGQDLQVSRDPGDVLRPAELPGHISTGGSLPGQTPPLPPARQLCSRSPRCWQAPRGQPCCPWASCAGYASARSRHFALLLMLFTGSFSSACTLQRADHLGGKGIVHPWP